jgi:hypothetical protein
MTFVPLFELRDIYVDNLTDIGNRKYGGSFENDKGGDLWGRKAFLQWVMNDGKLIFNDLSSIHGARYEKKEKDKIVKRSILRHSSHTSGVEVDIRYANPITGVGNADNISKTYGELNLTKSNFTYTTYDIYSGFNSDNSSGNTIANLSGKAKAELADNKTAKPNLNNFKDWIKTNRLMMEYYYDNLTASFGSPPQIFYGNNLGKDIPQGFYKMMHDGSFYDGSTSVAGEWSNSTRTKISPHDGHYDHWHITAPVKRE